MSGFTKEMAAEIIRDSTHNLVVNEENELDNKLYFDRLKYFIGMLEGSESGAYIDGILDPKKPTQFISAKDFYALDELTQNKLRGESKREIPTVGIGANIESEEIRNQFDILLDTPGLMNKVYLGQAELTNEQISVIFRNCTEERLVKLKRIYGSDWPKLRVNERITIMSLYFNLPGLADGSTNLRRHIKNYVSKDDKTHLKLAVKEITEKSNPNKSPGIQNRRNPEGAVLASFNSPTYTKPSQSPDSVKIKTAKLKSTIVPLNNDKPVLGTNSEYFVWRTEMDKKVRAIYSQRHQASNIVY